MPQFPSLPEVAKLSDLLMRFPKNAVPLITYVDAVMRADGALSIAQRELIAAYVSGLNACQFCLGAHVAHAQAFGIDPDLVAALLEDVETAEIDDALRPMMRYVAKLNALPHRLTQADATDVFAAGWSEEALFEAIEVASLFNMMNRLVDGSGVGPIERASASADEQPSKAARNMGLLLGTRPSLAPIKYTYRHQLQGKPPSETLHRHSRRTVQRSQCHAGSTAGPSEPWRRILCTSRL